MMLLTHSREIGVKISYKRIVLIDLGWPWHCRVLLRSGWEKGASMAFDRPWLVLYLYLADYMGPI